MKMRYQTLILLLLSLAMSGWMLWARWTTVAFHPIAFTSAQPRTSGAEPMQLRAESPIPPPPTPPPPMPTPAMTMAVGADWPTYISTSWGITLRYPPEWAYEDVNLSVGSPISLSPIGSSRPYIYIILQQYRLSEDGSLAEWVTLYNEWAGMNGMMGTTPLHLYTVLPEYLPEGIEQGIFSVDETPYNPRKVLWLERNGFVYLISSIYSRPEEMALTFAVVSSLTFDAETEAHLLELNAFQGNEETLRQNIAAAQPEPTPECDRACQDERDLIANYVAPAATAKALPPLERPTAQPYSPLPVGDDWIPYEQPVMGIRFRYPPGWQVYDLFKESNAGDLAALHTGISVSSNDRERSQSFTIILSPYLLGKDTPLYNWEAIRHTLNRAGQRDDNFLFPYRTFAPVDPRYFPRQADDLIYTDRLWISVNQFVYEVTGYTPLVAAIVSTLEFDEAHLEKLRSLGIFWGDERKMITDIVNSWVTPTPIPPPSPTPQVRATFTPSAFDSPLVNGLQRYLGYTVYNDVPPYDIGFNPAIWQLTADAAGRHYLVHQSIMGCEIDLGAWVTHALLLAPIELAGREWTIATTFSANSKTLIYGTDWDGGGKSFVITLPTPLPDPYDPDNKSQCELDAEAIFNTLVIVEAEVKPTPSAILPTVTPTP